MLYFRTEEEEEASDCLLRTSYCSSSEKGVKEQHTKLSMKKIPKRCVAKSPPDLDVGVNFSSSGVNEAVKFPSPQNKRRSRSCSKVMKQSSLDCYMHTVTSEKSALLLSEPKAGVAQEPRQSNRSQICFSFSSMETGVRQNPQSIKEIKANSDSGDWDSTRLPKLACSPKSNDLKIQKALNKKKEVDVSSSGDRFDTHNDNHNDDDGVFEDYFTSASDIPKRKVLVMHSASEAERLPSFDLEPLIRTRRKSHSQENCSRNGKSKAFNEKGIMAASGTPEEELLASCMDACLPGPEESEFEIPEQEPAVKKQRRRTKQNLVTLSESKDDKKHP